MKFFYRFQLILLTIIFTFVTTTSNSMAQVIAPLGQPVPEGAVQVSPEEFKELKKHEIKHNEKDDTFPPVISETAKFSPGFVGGEGAIVVFAILGTVLVIAWIPYVAYLTYRKIKYPANYKFTQIASINVTYIEDSKENDLKRKGVMSALRYTPLLSKIYSEPSKNPSNFYFGFNFELGHFDFFDQNKLTFNKQYYHSPYWIVGPSFVGGDLTGTDHSVFAKIDLTAGSSFSQDVDLILKAELSLNILFDKLFFAGAGGGLLYLYGREGKGIVTNLNRTTLQGFVNFGIVFQ